jgi:hypothetical protein
MPRPAQPFDVAAAGDVSRHDDRAAARARGDRAQLGFAPRRQREAMSLRAELHGERSTNPAARSGNHDVFHRSSRSRRRVGLGAG